MTWNKTGIILAPTIRSLVYLQVFQALGVVFDSIILLPGEMQKHDLDVSILDVPFYHSEGSVSLNFDISLSEFLGLGHTPFIIAPTPDVNSTDFVEFLQAQSSDVYVYSGMPGVLLREGLHNESHKRFLHAHGGDAPRYSGCTSF